MKVSSQATETPPTTAQITCDYPELKILSNKNNEIFVVHDKDSMEKEMVRFSDMANVCDGVTKDTCCSNDMFNKIKTTWNEKLKKENNSLSKTIESINSILAVNLQPLRQYADTTLPMLLKQN